MDLRQVALTLSKASTFLSKDEQADLFVICHEVKLYLSELACQLLRRHQSGCVLLGYVADATLSHVKWRLNQSVPSSGGPSHTNKLQRAAVRASEYLLQRVYCKALLAGSVEVVSVPFPPIPLHHGKKSWNLFAAGETSLQSFLQTAINNELRVIHICCDRGALTGTARKLHQHVCQKMGVQVPGDREIESDLSLRTLFVSTGCAIHDCHNALKYGLAKYMHCGGAFSLELHSLTKQIRLLLPALHDAIPSFVSKHVRFRQEDELEADIRIFWTCLGIPEHWLNVFVRVNPRCQGNLIEINASLQEAEDCAEVVTSVLCFCLRFRLHVESRWLSVGAAARCWLLAAMCGIPLLIGQARSQGTTDTSISEKVAAAFESEHVYRFTCLAAIASYPVEGLEAKLMEDSRLCLRWSEYSQVYDDTSAWLQALPSCVWDRLIQVCPHTVTPSELRDEIMNAVIVMRGYLHLRIDQSLAQYPWCLAIGNRAENLQQLYTSTQIPQDPTAAKIRVMLRSGSWKLRSRVAPIPPTLTFSPLNS